MAQSSTEVDATTLQTVLAYKGRCPFVAVYAVRGPEDNWVAFVCEGADPDQKFLRFDLTHKCDYDFSLRGETYIWGRLATELRYASRVRSKQEPDMRTSGVVAFVDCSGSMDNHNSLHKAALTSLLEHPVTVPHGEMVFLVITDGDDNKSLPPYDGQSGIAKVFEDAFEWGWDCGAKVPANCIGRLRVTVLDMSPNGIVAATVEASGAPVAVVATRDPFEIMTVVRGAKPPHARVGRVGIDAFAPLPTIVGSRKREPNQTLAEQPNEKRCRDLCALVDRRLGLLPSESRYAAKAELITTLDAICDSKSVVVSKRATKFNRRLQYHSDINFLLYSLLKTDHVEKTDTNPPVWKIGIHKEEMKTQLAQLKK